jgi:hypothetical protein
MDGGSIAGSIIAAPFGSSHSNVSFASVTDSTSPSSYVTTCSPLAASKDVTMPEK